MTEPTLDQSRALFARAERVIPRGVYGHQNAAQHGDRHPRFFARGEGSRVWDVDGNEYVDWMCAYGPMVLGYRNPFMTAKAAASLDVLSGGQPAVRGEGVVGDEAGVEAGRLDRAGHLGNGGTGQELAGPFDLLGGELDREAHGSSCRLVPIPMALWPPRPRREGIPLSPTSGQGPPGRICSDLHVFWARTGNPCHVTIRTVS